MRMVSVVLTVVAIVAMFGCSSDKDLRSQLQKLQQDNIEMQKKVTAIDAKVEPKTALKISRDETNRSIQELRAVVDGLKKQVELLEEERDAHSAHLATLDEALGKLADYVATLPTSDDVDEKIKTAVQALLNHFNGLLRSQQLELSLRIDRLSDQIYADLDREREEMLGLIGRVMALGQQQDQRLMQLQSQLNALDARVTEADRQLLTRIRAELVTALRDLQAQIRRDIEAKIREVNEALRNLPAEIGRQIRALLGW